MTRKRGCFRWYLTFPLKYDAMISGNTVFGRSDKEGHGRGEQLIVLSGSENMHNTFCREQEIGDNWKQNWSKYASKWKDCEYIIYNPLVWKMQGSEKDTHVIELTGKI